MAVKTNKERNKVFSLILAVSTSEPTVYRTKYLNTNKKKNRHSFSLIRWTRLEKLQLMKKAY